MVKYLCKLLRGALKQLKEQNIMSTTIAKKPITNGLLWIFAVGQFGWSLLSGVIATWVVHMFAGVADSDAWTNGVFKAFITDYKFLGIITIFGLIQAIGRVFDAITDPLVASWSDRANFKGGRRIPFMRAIAIPFAVCTVAVFVVPTMFSVEVNTVLMFVLMLLFYLFMTIYCTPYNALIAELGDTQKHRINVSTYISFTYIAGFSIATFVPNLAGMLKGFAGTDENAIKLAVGIMAAVAAVAMLVPALFINERRYIDSKPVKTPAFSSLTKTFKNARFRRFVYADVIYFFAVTLFQTGLADFETRIMGIDSNNTFMLTVIMTAFSLLLYPVVNLLAPKFGKKILIIIGFFVYSAGFLITALSGKGFVWGVLVAVSAGVPMAILGILPQACVADVSELSTLETGEDRSGMFFAARTFAMKMGQALAVLIYTSITAYATAENIMPYRAAAFVATAFCLLGAILFLFYNEKEIMDKIKGHKDKE